MMIKVLHIVGARPQFIKLGPLYTEMKNNGFDQSILHTGQHYDQNMSDVFFDELNIPKPDYNLNIHNLPHGAMTGRMIEQIETILLKTKYDYVIVYGDTNSTLAGAIAAKKLNIKIIHIEAGVRNYDNTMPEEINRILTDHISDLLLCVTDLGVDNLKKEGFNSTIIHNVGDLMLDSALLYNTTDIQDDDYILVTCHRASNTTKNELTNIINALNILSKSYNIIFPVHPRTKNIIDKFNIKCNFKIYNPVGYHDLIDLVKKCKFVLTDSGGLIREAYFFKKPSLLLLNEPLWPELINAGVSYNCIPDTDTILNSIDKLKNLKITYISGILGNGNSRKNIVNIIKEYDRQIHKIS